MEILGNCRKPEETSISTSTPADRRASVIFGLGRSRPRCVAGFRHAPSAASDRGALVRWRHDATRDGCAFLPRSARPRVFSRPCSVIDDITVSCLRSLARCGVVRPFAARLDGQGHGRADQVRIDSPYLPIASLSGGNDRRRCSAADRHQAPRAPPQRSAPRRRISAPARPLQGARRRLAAAEGIGVLFLSTGWSSSCLLSSASSSSTVGGGGGRSTGARSTSGA